MCILAVLKASTVSRTSPGLSSTNKTSTGALEFRSPMQPLKKYKNPLEVLRLNAQTVISHRKGPLLGTVPGGGDVHCRHLSSVIFNGGSHQVLKYLRQLRIVRGNDQQRIMSHHRAALFDSAA